MKTALKKQIEEYPRLEGESALRWLDRLNAKSEEERKAHETSMLQWGALAGFVAAIVNPFTGIVVFLLGLLYPSKRK